MQEMGPRDAPSDGGQQWGIPSGTASREGAEGNSDFDTQSKYGIIDASRSNEDPERVPDEEPAGCMEGMSSDGWLAAHTQPPEPTPTTPLFRKDESGPMVNSDVCRVGKEQSNSSSVAEVRAQAAQALLLSDLSMEGAVAAEEADYDAGIGVEDWLDVTHALLDTSGCGQDVG